ncbi:predicted protein [Nematostella vectensis]|uniref:DNA polymerase kappa n=1 Tax=Nematostella vectensis TaxID=45351 RepID=A7T4A2_NEMVE|nr:predicted protein [Nematostella vectensis]|eukprot:XP_001621312.1 hypothetical protein NEMVEDRAFT_v1g231426 [Nematostella vectensis]
MSLNDHKAGMEGLDKEKINKIIYESSKGSRFYENELKREKQVNERIKRQSEKLGACSEHELAEAMVEADRVVQELESGRDMSRTIVHVDMDAFYAAVEMRDDPSLKDKPMAVGSTSMLSTSNYPARRYGVRAAMPGFIAKKLCPHLIIVPLHFDKYRAVSKIVRGIFREYDPRFVPMSLDEAYLDLTDYLIERQRKTEKRLFYKKVYRQTSPSAGVPSESESSEACGSNTAQESENVPSVAESVGEPIEFGNDVKDVVQEIRFRIENETQLTASAGIACNVLLAKVCTDCNKPNGQFYLKPDREEIVSFVKTLPIRKISGIGRVSEQMLKALGVITCADLFEKRDLLVLLHSDISSRFLIEVALGLGATRLETDRGRKSLGTERTFSEISNPAQLFSECEQLCKAIAVDMNEEGLRPKTVTIKLKTINFELKTRSVSFRQGITSEKELIASAFDLLGKEIKACEPKPLKLRLMGYKAGKRRSQGKVGSQPKKRTMETFWSK